MRKEDQVIERYRQNWEVIRLRSGLKLERESYHQQIHSIDSKNPMRTPATHRFVVSAVLISTVLLLSMIGQFLARDWYVKSATKITFLELFQNRGDYPWTTGNMLRFEIAGDPLLVHKQVCSQRGWLFYGAGNCQYFYIVDLGPSFYISISKTLTSSRTTPIYLTLSEAYTLHKKEP